MKLVLPLIALVCVGCTPMRPEGASPLPAPTEAFACREVTIYGRKYLIQNQEIGYMRGTEWRVVAGPLD